MRLVDFLVVYAEAAEDLAEEAATVKAEQETMIARARARGKRGGK